MTLLSQYLRYKGYISTECSLGRMIFFVENSKSWKKLLWLGFHKEGHICTPARLFESFQCPWCKQSLSFTRICKAQKPLIFIQEDQTGEQREKERQKAQAMENRLKEHSATQLFVCSLSGAENRGQVKIAVDHKKCREQQTKRDQVTSV